MKKFFIFLSTSLIALSLISCGKSKTYTVVWQNYDNSVLETDEKVKKGEMPQYDGAIPTRETDETFVYEFAGWSPELTKVSKDVTYVATFTATRYYHISFVNYDSNSLYQENVLEGSMPQYEGDNPVKPEDEENTYSFSGWTPEISAASEDKTYVATFTARAIAYYKVTFLNYNDTLLYETTVREGRAAVYEGETPTKPEDEEYTYEFDGWDQDLSSINSEMIAKAKFKRTSKWENPVIWF